MDRKLFVLQVRAEQKSIDVIKRVEIDDLPKYATVEAVLAYCRSKEVAKELYLNRRIGEIQMEPISIEGWQTECLVEPE